MNLIFYMEDVGTHEVEIVYPLYRYLNVPLYSVPSDPMKTVTLREGSVLNCFNSIR